MFKELMNWIVIKAEDAWDTLKDCLRDVLRMAEEALIFIVIVIGAGHTTYAILLQRRVNEELALCCGLVAAFGVLSLVYYRRFRRRGSRS